MPRVRLKPLSRYQFSTEITVRTTDLNYGGHLGNDRLLSASVARGGGSITAVASVAPELVAAAQRDPQRQPDLDAVRELLESYGLGPAVKAVLRHKGIGAYRTRPPLLDLDRESEVRLIREFDDEVPGPRQTTSP